MSSKFCPFCGSPVAVTARFCPVCGSALHTSITDGNNSSILVPGTAIAGDKYTVEQVLGRGGFGITYLGTDQQLKRRVAIKEFFPLGSVRRGTTVVPPDTLGAQDYVTATERFLEESQMLCRFTHPSIVTVYEVFRDNGTAYMVMEYLQGETLAQRLERVGGQPLAESELLRLTEPLIRALEQIHAASVIHRDIKPDNIVVVQRDGAERPCHAPHDLVKWECETPAPLCGLQPTHA